MSSEVLDIISFEYDPEAEKVYIRAIVDDAVPFVQGNRIDPPESVAGICTAEVFWPEDFPPPTKQQLKDYEYEDQSWELVPFPDL